VKLVDIGCCVELLFFKMSSSPELF
jgi:hypothetical protein